MSFTVTVPKMGCKTQDEVIRGFYHAHGYRIEYITDAQWRYACDLFTEIVDPAVHGYGTAYHLAIAKAVNLDINNLPIVDYSSN
jgi:hypothetical protein